MQILVVGIEMPVFFQASRRGESDASMISDQPKLVHVSIENAVATLTLNRPEVRNAIDDAMRAEFVKILGDLDSDQDVRVVIVTGAGKAFCAGGDVSGMQERLKASADTIAHNGWRRQKQTHRSIALLHGISKPTIAAVNGSAVGLGCDLALACDFIIAAKSAKFAMSFINRGLVSDGGGMYFLPRRVGLSKAKEMIFTGKEVQSAEALEIGLADRVAEDQDLLDEARRWAVELGAGSPTAIALAKPILDRTFESSEEQVFALGRQAQAICYTSAEHRSSVQAFLNRKSKAGSAV
jgi:enoyl-CoA hydratase/carnithine racemase